MEDNHEKLKKEEIDQTKLSPTATELIAKYGNASTTIGGTFVLAGDFDYRDKTKKELEDYITELETQNQDLSTICGSPTGCHFQSRLLCTGRCVNNVQLF